jgi:hypothetical protein
MDTLSPTLEHFPAPDDVLEPRTSSRRARILRRIGIAGLIVAAGLGGWFAPLALDKHVVSDVHAQTLSELAAARAEIVRLGDELVIAQESAEESESENDELTSEVAALDNRLDSALEKVAFYEAAPDFSWRYPADFEFHDVTVEETAKGKFAIAADITNEGGYIADAHWSVKITNGVSVIGYAYAETSGIGPGQRFDVEFESTDKYTADFDELEFDLDQYDY